MTKGRLPYLGLVACLVGLPIDAKAEVASNAGHPVEARPSQLRKAVRAAKPATKVRSRKTKRSKLAASARPKPALHSAAVYAVDADSDAVLFAKNADKIRPIASTGKLMVAMTVRQRGLDLDDYTKISKVDRTLARGGARTRLDVGKEFSNRDLLRAMLIASDNRAPSALGRGAGMSWKELVREMNKFSKRLGLKHTRFTEPTGIRGNRSTAKEMAQVLGEVLKDPQLAATIATRSATVKTKRYGRTIHYRNTNRALHDARLKIIGGKTGFTTPAGHCVITAAKIGTRTVLISLLGAKSKAKLYRDLRTLRAWVAKQGF